MVTRLTQRRGFHSEKDLEDYLETRLWLTGQDLVVIGRQVKIPGDSGAQRVLAASFSPGLDVIIPD